MYEYLDRRYAKALFEVAERKDKVEVFLRDLSFVCDVIDNNKELRKLIDHPEISLLKKKNIFTKMFKGKIDDELLTFIYIILEKGRILYLREKLNELEEMYLEKLNTIKATVKTAVPLSKEQYLALVDKIEKSYDKNVILEQQVTDEIIGGVYLRIKNDIIDGTIASRYEDIRKNMIDKKA